MQNNCTQRAQVENNVLSSQNPRYYCSRGEECLVAIHLWMDENILWSVKTEVCHLEIYHRASLLKTSLFHYTEFVVDPSFTGR